MWLRHRYKLFARAKKRNRMWKGGKEERTIAVTTNGTEFGNSTRLRRGAPPDCSGLPGAPPDGSGRMTAHPCSQVLGGKFLWHNLSPQS